LTVERDRRDGEVEEHPGDAPALHQPAALIAQRRGSCGLNLMRDHALPCALIDHHRGSCGLNLMRDRAVPCALIHHRRGYSGLNLMGDHALLSGLTDHQRGYCGLNLMGDHDLLFNVASWKLDTESTSHCIVHQSLCCSRSVLVVLFNGADDA
jgi:hypothetical protein